MRFKIVWLENHYIDNWVSDDFEGDLYGEEAYDNATKQMLAQVPNGKITHSYPDGCVEIEAWDIFEAKNIEEAKKFVEENYSDVEIFSVFTSDGGRAFTEEDYE